MNMIKKQLIAVAWWVLEWLEPEEDEVVAREIQREKENLDRALRLADEMSQRYQALPGATGGAGVRAGESARDARMPGGGMERGVRVGEPGGGPGDVHGAE
jgi:hypothetical protein